MTAASHTPWIALSLIHGMGMGRLNRLSAAFNGDLSAAIRADAAALMGVRGIGAALASAIRAVRLDQVAAQIAAWERAGVGIVTRRDADYPAPLARLSDAPPTLFVYPRGDANPFAPTPLDDCLARPCIAVVGTRQPSDAGMFAARAVGDAVGRRGGTLISGYAVGVDWLAHAGALINGGLSIAVLGSGVLNAYPPQHRAAVGRFVKRGGVFVSELAPFAHPSASTLVARNRIISGLARAVIMVESNPNGGAMHTVRFARGQGIPVSTLDLSASGNRALIAAGVPILALDALQSDTWLSEKPKATSDE